MSIFKKLFQESKLRHKKEIVKLFSLLGYKLNSYHSLAVKVNNLISSKQENVIVYNQFVPSYMRHPIERLRVGYWRLEATDLKKIKSVISFDFFGDTKKYPYVEFYFPLDLSAEYPGLLEALSDPQEMLEGHLNPSGRSIWVLPEKRNPVCLKIDTIQLNNRRFFSERVLLPRGVEHSIFATDYLKHQIYNCSEDRGGNIFFNYNYSDGTPKRYTYLLREFDFKKLGICRNDFLIPVVAILSTEFWSNAELLHNIEIKKSATEFLAEDFAKCYADLIRNSLDKTFLHFEMHQQNLSLHMRNGNAVKIIYHDLQDSVFDPITYFLKQCSENGFKNINQYYDFILSFQKTSALNVHGHLLLHDQVTREYFTVTSIYRRYLRNFGGYNKSLNYFINSIRNQGEYFLDRSFECQILKYLAFEGQNLNLNEEVFNSKKDKGFLENDLFWSIHHYHAVLQKKLFDQFKHAILNSKQRVKEIDVSKLESMLKTTVTICSTGFPTNISNIDFSAVTKVIDVFNERILLVTYENKDFLLIRR